MGGARAVTEGVAHVGVAPKACVRMCFSGALHVGLRPLALPHCSSIIEWHAGACACTRTSHMPPRRACAQAQMQTCMRMRRRRCRCGCRLFEGASRPLLMAAACGPNAVCGHGSGTCKEYIKEGNGGRLGCRALWGCALVGSALS